MFYFFSSFYLKLYVVIAVSYLWYRFGMLFLTEWREEKEAFIPSDSKISVIVPFFNEEPEVLDQSIQSLLAAKGNKEIIVVDDGSSDKACATMIMQKYKNVLTFVRYEKNRGKRHAQSMGFLYAKGDYIITVDSDTIVDEWALLTLINPMLHDTSVGATTGNVQVLNESDNILTKMIASRYWNAFNVERKSLSRFGIVTCCSGVLSAYRKDIFEQLLPAYTSQRFLGSECTYGDDRHLTNLILKQKYQVKYVGDALCYTVVPTKLGQFIRQQLRWKKSFLRESFITLQFAFKHSFLLPIEVLYNLIIPFLSIGIRLSIIATLIVYPTYIIPFIISVATVAVIRNFFLFFENKKLAFYSIPYAFVHELVLFWLYFWALFTLRNRSWGTR